MKKKGKGVSLVYYPVGSKGGGDTTQAFVKIKPDGGADLFLGSVELGQGIKTIATQILSDELGIPYDQIVIHNASTDDCGICTGSFASRVTYFAGNAVRAAAADARNQLFEAAAEELNVKMEELTAKDGLIYSINDSSKSIKISDLASKLNFGLGKLILGRGYFWKEPAKVLDEENGQVDIITELSYGGSYAEVEVDTETGEVVVEKMVNVFDTGKTINPLLVMGQIDGGVVMGISSALYEATYPNYPSIEFQPKSLGDYIIPTTADIPEMKSSYIEYPAPNGPFGAKGIGEMTANTAAPAIANAIYDAVGVWINEVPITPEKVLKALDELKKN